MNAFCALFSTACDGPELGRRALEALSALGSTTSAPELIHFTGAGVVAAQPGAVSSHAPATETAGGGRTVCTGQFAAAPDRQTGNPATRLAVTLAAGGPQALRDIDGVFAAIHHDPTGKRVLIASDRYAFFPLYYYAGEDLLMVSCECKALTRTLPGLTPDAGGYGDFFYFGHTISNRTIFREIKTLAPGQYLEWREGKTTCHRYWSVSEIPVRDPADVSAVEPNARFVGAVESLLDRSRPQTLLLSAGFDSRLILGALLKLGCRPDILHVAWDRERGLAPRLAKSLGLDCRVVPLRGAPQAFLDAFEAFYAVDGMKTTFYPVPIPAATVPPYLEEGMGCVWDGLVMGQLGGSQIRSASFPANLRLSLFLRARNQPLLRMILRRDWYECIEREFWHGLRRETESFPAGADGWGRFLVANRIRRRGAVNPHQIFRRKASIITPGAMPSFVDFLLTVPAALRRDYRLYVELYKQCYPELMRVPIVSGAKYFDWTEARRRHSGMRHHGKRLGILARRLGVMPHLEKVLRAKYRSPYTQPAFMLNVVRRGGLGNDMFRQDVVQKILRKVEGRSHAWLDALAIVFFVELWRLLMVEGRYPELADELRAMLPTPAGSEPPTSHPPET